MRAGVCAIFFFSWLGPIWAQAEEASVQLERARAYLAQGNKAFHDGLYPLAIEKFGAAKELSNDPRILVSLAESFRKVGRVGKAARLYRAFLEIEAGAIDPKFSESVRKRLVECESMVAFVSIPYRSVASEAKIDDEVLGRLPLHRVPVTPGYRRIRVESEATTHHDQAYSFEQGRATVIEWAPLATVETGRDPSLIATNVDDDALEASSSSSVFETWWFWTGVGVVVSAATIGVIIAAGGGSNSSGNPSGSLGTTDSGTWVRF